MGFGYIIHTLKEVAQLADRSPQIDGRIAAKCRSISQLLNYVKTCADVRDCNGSDLCRWDKDSRPPIGFYWFLDSVDGQPEWIVTHVYPDVDDGSLRMSYYDNYIPLIFPLYGPLKDPVFNEIPEVNEDE